MVLVNFLSFSNVVEFEVDHWMKDNSFHFLVTKQVGIYHWLYQQLICLQIGQKMRQLVISRLSVKSSPRGTYLSSITLLWSTPCLKSPQPDHITQQNNYSRNVAPTLSIIQVSVFATFKYSGEYFVILSLAFLALCPLRYCLCL